MSDSNQLPLVATAAVVLLLAAGSVMWVNASRLFESEREALIRATKERVEEARKADGRDRTWIETDAMLVQFLVPEVSWSEGTLAATRVELVEERSATLKSTDYAVFSDSNGNGALDLGEPVMRWAIKDRLHLSLIHI